MKFMALAFYVVAWVFAFFTNHYQPGDFLTLLLMNVFLFSVGVRYLWEFVGFVFCQDKVADCLGRKESCFQYEVGMALLGFGVLGILSFSYQSLWLATSIVAVIYCVGDVYGYLMSSSRSKDSKKPCSGVGSFTSFLVALTLIIGMLMHFKIVS